MEKTRDSHRPLILIFQKFHETYLSSFNWNLIEIIRLSIY